MRMVGVGVTTRRGAGGIISRYARNRFEQRLIYHRKVRLLVPKGWKLSAPRAQEKKKKKNKPDVSPKIQTEATRRNARICQFRI